MRAMFSNDEAVSELIGVILALGIAVLALAVIQTTSVPVWDGALEQDHNLVIYNDFMQLRSNTFADSPSSAPIEMGFLYPNRILLRNPTRGVTGTIVTKNQTIRVQGIVSGGVEWAMNDSVEKWSDVANWTKYDLHANASNVTGAKLIYVFNGTNLSIDFWRTNYSGFASVSVDDIVYKQINLYTNRSQYAYTNGTNQTYPIVDGLDFGTHTVEVEVMGTHSYSSSLGANNNSVIVDGFRPGVTYINATYNTSVISYSADNNFATTPDIVLEHALILKAYNDYTYTATSLQVAPDSIYLPLIHTPETYIPSIESISVDTAPDYTIEHVLINATISFETDYPNIWYSSIIPNLKNKGIIATLSDNNITIHCNNSTRLIMPVIIATIGGDESGGTGASVADITLPHIEFIIKPNQITSDTTPFISANYSDASGINKSSVRVYLDGVEHFSNFSTFDDHVNYTPSTLAPGWHNVIIEVSDTSGNTGSTGTCEFFVVTEPWVDIKSPTNASQSNVSRGYNVTVDFTYTDTNAKAYIINISNSNTTITSGPWYVSNSSGINIPVSKSILIPSNTALGLYNVSVWMNDTTGNSNSSIEVGAVNVTIAPLITIIRPTNTSQSNVLRGYNVTVNFNYTDTNAKAYIVNINNSTTTIATVTNNVATSGTNISVSVNLTISANAAVGLYNVSVWMNDTSGLSNSSIEVGAVNVISAPLITIISPTNTSQSNVLRGYNVTVNFTYTDTNAKTYIININNSNTTITSGPWNVSNSSGINIPVSKSILIPANATVGLYDVWVWMNDTSGLSNSSIEVDAVNVISAPLITIISPTNTSQSNVSRGYNVIVNFTYTDTNAKTYIVNINNSITTIATVTNNVTTNGTNISVSENLIIPANAAVGLYDVWVWMNDTSGLSNSSLEFGAVNVTMVQAEHLVLDTSSVKYNGDGDTEIEKFKISNNGTSDIVINQIIVSWIPNSSQKIKEVKIKDTDPDSKWEGKEDYVPSVSSPSGTTLTLNNPLTMHISDSHNMDFYFDTDMTGKTFNVTFLLGDGSSKTVVFTP